MPTSFIRKLPFVFLLALIAVTLIAPSVSFAQSLPNVWSPTSLQGPILVCTGANAAGGVLNKNCGNLCDLIFQVLYIVYLMIAAVIWVIAPLSFVVGGIMYMIAGAKPDMAGTAKQIITGAVIGTVIVLCSYLIINTFVSFFQITGVGGFGISTCNVQ